MHHRQELERKLQQLKDRICWWKDATGADYENTDSDIHTDNDCAMNRAIWESHSLNLNICSLSLSLSLSLSWSFSPSYSLSLSRFVFFCISPKGSKGYGRRSICVVLVLIYASKRCKRGMRPFSSMLLAHRKRLCDTVLKLRGGRYKMIQPMMFQDWSPLDENQ